VAEDGATWIRARVADAPPFEYVELEKRGSGACGRGGVGVGPSLHLGMDGPGPAGRVYSRLLAPDLGVAEDPATGSAALVLGVSFGAGGRDRAGRRVCAEGAAGGAGRVVGGWRFRGVRRCA
jgi:predicted PhzF superfamily epimerase YddE/YHI9